VHWERELWPRSWWNWLDAVVIIVAVIESWKTSRE